MRRPGDLIVKDPDSTEPQGLDWTTFCQELGASVAIASSTWTVSGPDLALTTSNPTTPTSAIVDGVTKVGNFAQIFLAGGTPGKRYTVTNHITTNTTPAVIDDRSFSVRILNR